MVIENIGTNNQQTRDQFSQEPDIQTITKLKSDNILIKQVSVIAKMYNIGNSFSLDSPLNGVLSTWSDTKNSKDLFIGSQNKVLVQTVTMV